jgi:hypothetical protein
VNYEKTGRRERAIQSAAERFSPDLVLVAGDFLEEERALRRADVLESAQEVLAALPAPAGHFLAPGEEEAAVAASLRQAWTDERVQILSNEARTLDVRGERLDLFVADPSADPPPWWIGARTVVRFGAGPPSEPRAHAPGLLSRNGADRDHLRLRGRWTRRRWWRSASHGRRSRPQSPTGPRSAWAGGSSATSTV